MKRYTLACLSLTASAFVLAGLLIVQIHNRMPQAQAGLVINAGGLMMLTAQTANDQESIFLIDSSSNALLIYETDTVRGDLVLKRTENLSQLFNLQKDNAAAGGGAPARRAR